MRQNSRLALFALALLFVVAFAAPSFSQVVNPKTVAFTVSADHNTVVLGTPVVTRYELRFYVGTVPAPHVFDLGKPVTPTISEVVVTNPAIFAPLANNAYTARVVAIGPGGEGASELTAPFGQIGQPLPATAPAIRP